MRLGWVRAIDRYVGPSVCLALTGWDRLARLVRPAVKADHDAVYRILFVKLSEIGAVLCARPLFRKIKDDYPQAEKVFVTFAKSKAVFDLLAADIGADRVLVIRLDTPWHFIVDTGKVLGFLIPHHFDIAFDLELFARFSVILTYLSGAARRVGFYRYTVEGVYRGDLLTHRVAYNPLTHISRSFYSLYLALNKTERGPQLDDNIPEEEMVLPHYTPPDKDLRQLRELLQQAGVQPGHKVLLLHIGDGLLPLREWPFEYHRQLAQRLLTRSDMFLVYVGTHSDDAAIERLMSLAPGRCLNLNRRTSLPELMALFQLGSLVFSTDCGLLHLAALSGINKVVLFGPESPAVFAPMGDRVRVVYKDLPCSPCFSAFNHRASACRNNLCLKKISPDDVFQIISQTL